MSHMFTIDVPADVAERAQVVAAKTHRQVEDVLIEWLGHASTEIPLEWLPDADIQALCELHLAEDDQHDLTTLLADQREGRLDSAGRARLDQLLQTYRSGMVRKAQALNVAVDRGLRPPLSN